VSASRTVTGGDSYAQCNALFGCPELIFIASETGVASPTEVTILKQKSVIRSVNTYRVCHVDMEGSWEPQVRCSRSLLHFTCLIDGEQHGSHEAPPPAPLPLYRGDAHLPNVG
jgi:hypothetical protein